MSATSSANRAGRGERRDPGGSAVGRYGPRRARPGLTEQRIVEAGRAVIERDGLDALTMRAVAAELDTAPGSLYRHVSDRGALLQQILEELAAPLPTDVPGATAADRLINRWIEFHDYMSGHVWALHVLVAGSRVARNALPFSDACLSDFCAAGLSLRAAGYAFRTCYQFTLGELLDTHPPAALDHPTPREAIVADASADDVPTFVALRDAEGASVAEDYRRTIEVLITALLSR